MDKMTNYGSAQTVVTNQPRTNQPLLHINDPNFPRGVGRPWTTDLFDCFADPIICLLACFLPCHICMMSQQMGEHVCMPLCVPGNLLTMRSYFRGKHNIEGNLISDCCSTIWCQPCTECQLAREIKLINDGHAKP
ncbi:cornifelin homolog A-like [Apostichopus japonicus]|uniref:cornifelin homolog A-like n=1 Tax=Stichopus japonicus TaxID=307972 RepID=UPI003AB79484